LAEFDALAQALEREGVEVFVAEDSASPEKPDAIFPNNWVSFHSDGSVVLYPMLAANRRLERREDIIGRVLREGRFHATRTIDLTYRESQDKYLEGTGSLVLDRAHRVAYASLSARTDLDVLGEFAQAMDYELVAFESFDGTAKSIYHTNVMMSVGTGFAVLCGDAIADSRQRTAVMSKLRASGHEIVDISFAQMQEFAANLLELAVDGGPVIALSSRAWQSLNGTQRAALEAQAHVLPVPIPVIERFGGGGVRCMLAEIHLQKSVRAP